MNTVGQLVTPKLEVDPYAGDTAAVLQLVDPDGDAVTLDVVSGDGGRTWTADELPLSAPGQWRLEWSVTGTGTGTVVQLIDVGPAAGDEIDGFSYATTGELARYSGKAPPPRAKTLLIAASREISRLTKSARYDTTVAGLAVNEPIRRALADATCELVGWWAETGNQSGFRSTLTSASIAGVSLGFGGTKQGATTQADRVGPAVITILDEAGLLARGPVMA